MAKIVILGCGVMGTAIAFPAARNNNDVVLIGSPLDDALIDAMGGAGRIHPGLGVPVPAAVELVQAERMSDSHFEGADVVLLGVSSPGLPWALDRVCRHVKCRPILMMVTKGLDVVDGQTTRTLPPMIDETLGRCLARTLPIVGVGGPCIAREIAGGLPTAAVFAATNQAIVEECRALFQRTDYQVRTTSDLIGLEACAAIKNLMTIGIAASWSATSDGNGNAAEKRNMNWAAACFQQAYAEMAMLCEWLGGRRETASGLAGMGDLFVTVNAGRNSRLGLELGSGSPISQALTGTMAGETVEGVETGVKLATGLKTAFSGGDLAPSALPFTCALVASIVDDIPFDIQPDAYWPGMGSFAE